MNTIWQPTLPEGVSPKYRAVVQLVQASIADGALAPGDKLPPVRDLAWRLGITPGTVARAYTVLTDEGTLTAGVGRGTFVAQPDPRSPLLIDAPIEVDSAPHNAPDTSGPVNLFSPHLPEVGQVRLIRALLGQIAQDPPSGLMHYPSRVGAIPARNAAAEWLADPALGRFSADDVQMASGGQNAIVLVMQALLTGRRPTVLVEELAYPGFRRAAELLRADVVPVAMDEDGLIPEALAAAARGTEAQVLCTSPEVHNPTLGYTPPARRAELARVIRAHDLQVIEDDCYRLGPARAEAYRAILPDRTWYVSSISKSITPALRLGFVIAPPGRIAGLRRTAEYAFFGLPTPMLDLCAALLVHPDLRGLMDSARAGINAYMRVAVNVLGGCDLRWRPDVPFLWLELPQGWRASAFVQAAEGQGVRLRAAEEYACRDARAPHAVRFAINAAVPVARFEDAMVRLRTLLENPPDEIGV